MTEKVFHYLLGYVRFTIAGDDARFLNAAARNGFGFWGFSRREDGLAEACCRAREYKKLRFLARRCKVRLRCRDKVGLPFFTRRLKRRKGLLAGVILGAGVFYFLSGSVWGVTVSGAEALGDRLVLAAAEKSGVYSGARRDEFDPKQVAHGIIAELPELKWAAVNTEGCFVQIAISEGRSTPDLTDDGALSNIVATREGTVLAVEAERGRPEVSPGDTVEAGDLLISGLFQEIPDPWKAHPPELYEYLGAARGRVIAETYREYTVQVSARKKLREKTGETRTDLALRLFGVRIPLNLRTAPERENVHRREVHTLTALGVPLPVALERDIYEFTGEREVFLSEAQMKSAALLKLRALQKGDISPGGSVLKEELSYAFPDGMCILTARCRCREDVGEVRPLLVETPENEENF